MDSRLDRRGAVVTGASRGIGRAIAETFSRAGCATVLTYASRERDAETTAEALVKDGLKASAQRLELESRETIRDLVNWTISEYGKIDIWVNNAAISQERPFLEITDSDWERMLRVNLQGAFACCQEVLPHMIQAGHGRIINITSIGGQWGGWMQAHYAASKAGLISLTRSLARIYSKSGITTNAIAPGLVATDMSANELDSEEGRRKVANIPAGRIAHMDEISRVALFLASDEASYITGQTLNVNGGMYFG